MLQRRYRLALAALELVSTPAHAKPTETSPAYCQLLAQLPPATREGYLEAYQNYFNGKPIATRSQYDQEKRLIDAFRAVPSDLQRQIENAFGDAHPDWRQELIRIIELLLSRSPNTQDTGKELLKHDTKMRAQIRRHCEPKIG